MICGRPPGWVIDAERFLAANPAFDLGEAWGLTGFA
jgi:hypothetical protein